MTVITRSRIRQRLHDAQRAPSVALSAAICTCDRPAQLARALQSLLDQSRPLAEIIVVDNMPDSKETRALVTSDFPTVHYVQEARRGLDFARNAALIHATQPVVAFLDDDAVADQRWAEALVECFEEDVQLGACTGRVEALSVADPGQRVVEANGGYSRGLRPVHLPRDARGRLRGRRAPLIAWAVSIGSGCSLAVRRDAALAIGGFDEILDGRGFPGGGDHDVLWRLLTAGYGVRYEPGAVAWHEHRRQRQAAYDQLVGHQRGLLAFLTKAAGFGTVRQRAGVFAFLAWRLTKPLTRIVRASFGQETLPLGVLLRMWLNCWQGVIAYPLARKRQRSSTP